MPNISTAGSIRLRAAYVLSLCCGTAVHRLLKRCANTLGKPVQPSVSTARATPIIGWRIYWTESVITSKMQLAQVVRAMVQALQDGKITPAEGMQLSMQGMALASSILTVVQGVDAATRQDILFVLEHGQIVVPES